jgi:hypothetical protein
MNLRNLNKTVRGWKMAEELGRIEKPETARFKGRRKLYLVPLLYSWEEAPEEYTEKFELYWKQVQEHIANLKSAWSDGCIMNRLPPRARAD